MATATKKSYSNSVDPTDVKQRIAFSKPPLRTADTKTWVAIHPTHKNMMQHIAISTEIWDGSKAITCENYPGARTIEDVHGVAQTVIGRIKAQYNEERGILMDKLEDYKKKEYPEDMIKPIEKRIAFLNRVPVFGYQHRFLVALSNNDEITRVNPKIKLGEHGGIIRIMKIMQFSKKEDIEMYNKDIDNSTPTATKDSDHVPCYLHAPLAENEEHPNYKFKWQEV